MEFEIKERDCMCCARQFDLYYCYNKGLRRVKVEIPLYTLFDGRNTIRV